jgi:protein-S-isoprenylcysteine O-methyltransferase Ste14
LLYALGFLAPWTLLPGWSSTGVSARASFEPAWLALSTLLYRQGWLTYNAAVLVLLGVAIVLTGLGAWLRLWGAAYAGSRLVPSGAGGLLADGPFRHTRNPLLLGTLLHTLGIALLMPPSGAAFAVVTLGLFQLRLALAEESSLATRLGPPYRDYAARVPRFLPAPAAQVAASGARPHWGLAVLGELYFLCAFLVLATLGWTLDGTTLRRALLISLGLWLIARAFLPRPAASETAPA